MKNAHFNPELSLCLFEIEAIRRERAEDVRLFKIRIDTIFANLQIAIRKTDALPADDIEALVEELSEKFHESQRIRCPHCEHIQSEETVAEHTTNDGGDLDCLCEECGKVFIVTERVTREFVCFPMPPRWEQKV